MGFFKRLGQSFGVVAPDVAQAKVDTSSLEEQRQQGNDAYRQWLEQAAQYGYQAPQINAAHSAYAGDVTMRDPGPVERYSASTVAAPDAVQVGLPQMAQGVQARDVSVPGASAATIGGATIDTAPSNQIRGQQVGNLSALSDAAAGRGPSAADALFANKLGDVTTTQMGAVGQARGTDRAAQRREAMLQIGRQGMEAANSAAALKAQEQQAARGQLTGALSDVRGTDVGLAAQQAGLTQEANLTNAGRETDVSKYNAGMAATVGAANADRSLGAQQFTAGAQNARDIEGAQLRERAGEVNAGNQLAAGTTNAGLLTGAAAANAGARNARDEYVTTTGAAIDTGNRNRAQTNNDTNAQFTQGANTANQTAAIQGQQITQQGQQNLRSSALQASGQAIQSASNAVNAQTQVATTNANNTNTANNQGLDRLSQTVTAGLKGASSSGAKNVASSGAGGGASGAGASGGGAATSDVGAVALAQTQAPSTPPPATPAPRGANIATDPNSGDNWAKSTSDAISRMPADQQAAAYAAAGQQAAAHNATWPPPPAATGAAGYNAMMAGYGPQPPANDYDSYLQSLAPLQRRAVV